MVVSYFEGDRVGMVVLQVSMFKCFRHVGKDIMCRTWVGRFIRSLWVRMELFHGVIFVFWL